MDPERAKIQADLRGVVQGDVLCDDLFVQMYATDASIYEIPPLGIVRPAGTHDVVATLKYCSEQGIPVHARGAGTCVAGESLGGGIVLDFSARMRRILRIGEDSVDVQPGVVLAQLNYALRPLGRLFGPDPATRSVTTMGSVVAIDNSGSHLPLYGTASDHLIRVQAALADGEVVEFVAPPKESPKDTVPYTPWPQPNAAAAARVEELSRRTGDLVDRFADVIERGKPATRVKPPGYRLGEVRENGGINLAKLMAGSEGTLAIVTELTVGVVPRPASRGVSLLFFDRLDKAAQGALAIQDLPFAACDLMDRRILALARESDPRYASLIPRTAEAMLLIEQCGADDREVRLAIEEIAHRLVRKSNLAFASRSTLKDSERNLYWRLARRVVPTLYRLRGPSRPLPFVEDVAVPPEQLPAMIVRLQNVLKTHAVTASMFCHAGHGVLHLRPFLSLADVGDVRRMERIATDLYETALDLGGIVGGEHGDGFSRTWFNRRQFGPLYDVYRETKRIFDPSNLLNPGKISPEIASPLTKNLRRVTLALANRDGTTAIEGEEETFATGGAEIVVPGAPKAIEPRGSDDGDGDEPVELPVISLALNWRPDEALRAARACNGCGRCRTTAADERMCPMFRALPREEAAPRSKANLFRAALTGSLPPADLSTDAMRAVADLCFNCHQCRFECPAGVDIPGLAAEIRAQYVQQNGPRPSDFFATRLHRVSSWGSSLSPITNWAIQQPVMRWLIERAFGIAQGRKLPRFARRPFHRIARRGPRTTAVHRSDRKVLYFVDVYANWHDVQLGKALIAVLERNGVRVIVPTEPLVSGMAMYVAGAVDAFRRHASRNVAYLAKYVRQGYDIVTTEPSAALCLTYEYRRVLDDEDTQVVAEKTRDACAYLWEMHQAGELDGNFRPIERTIGYHLPCHVRALGDTAPALELLRLVPDLDVRHVDEGCSGMAGTYGLRRRNFRTSLRIGRDLISAMRSSDLDAGSTECSACKMQMEQGVSKPTVHPIKILACAYGLMPEVERLFESKGEELVVT